MAIENLSHVAYVGDAKLKPAQLQQTIHTPTKRFILRVPVVGFKCKSGLLWVWIFSLERTIWAQSINLCVSLHINLCSEHESLFWIRRITSLLNVNVNKTTKLANWGYVVEFGSLEVHKWFVVDAKDSYENDQSFAPSVNLWLEVQIWAMSLIWVIRCRIWFAHSVNLLLWTNYFHYYFHQSKRIILRSPVFRSPEYESYSLNVNLLLGVQIFYMIH